MKMKEKELAVFKNVIYYSTLLNLKILNLKRQSTDLAMS